MINRVTLVGRLGKDPEGKTTSGGKSVANLSLATDNGYGEKKTTDWHRLTAWEKQADFATKYLHKGDLVFVEGRISYNTVGEGDEAKTFTNIVVSNIRSLHSANGNHTAVATENGTQAPAPAAISDEDIPF